MEFEVKVHFKSIGDVKISNIPIILEADIPNITKATIADRGQGFLRICIAVRDLIDLRALYNSFCKSIGVDDIAITVTPLKYSSAFGRKFWWKYDGISIFEDRSLYTSPYYYFHTPEGENYYICDLDVYTKNLMPHERERQYKDAKYIKDFIGVHDRRELLKSKTVEDAMKEFEEIYYHKLEDSMKKLQKEASASIDRFLEYNEYYNERKEI